MVVVTESSDRVVSEPTQLRRRSGIRLRRTVVHKSLVIPHENALAKLILDQHGRSTYDFFKVWLDKTYFFSGSKKSFISYTVSRGVALVLGDSVGPDADVMETTSSFMKYCSDNGWLVCFLLPDRISMYEAMGLDVLKVGEEAIVDLDHFCTSTAKAKYFRYHRNRFERRGFSITRYLPPHPIELMNEVEDVSKEWLMLPEHRELGFIQGRFTRSYIGQVPLYLVRDSTGLAVAFVNEVRSYRSGEATFDMMRYRPGVPNGTMDYLLDGMMLMLEQEGYRSFNLGLAPFAGLGKRPGAPLIEKALQLLFRINWFVSNKGIYDYKLKFEPQWNDRFGVYQGGPFGLVRIALAVTRAIEGNYSSESL
jgi:phosphatidylglycerol lysyltransferase